MTAATLRPPEAAGLGRGLTLALVAHGLLILALSYGLHWRSDSSPAFEAELWSAVPQVAAPREEAPPEPEPEAPKPEVPKPDTRAQQRAAEEAAAAEQQREAEIAIAKEKKRKEKEKEERARDDAAKLEREKAVKEKEAKDKAAKDKAAKEDQERAKKEKDAKAAKDAKEAKEAKDADARREALRQENLRRIQGMAGGTPGSTGAAAQNSGPSASWIGRVRAAIARSITFPGKTESENPEVAIRVFLAPDGKILAKRVIKPSPNPAWDTAVERGIESLGRVPLDSDKRLPEYLDLTLRPHENGINPG